MAIKGLTDRESCAPRFPRIGKLRKGGERVEKVNSKGEKYFTYGADLDHFRFTSDRPDVVAAFVAAYGERPQSLTVYLPHASAEDNFPTWKEAWTSGGLQHRCDGEMARLWLDSDGKYSRTPIACPGGCDEVGRLELILPELIAAGFVGTVTLETHSLNDMISLSGTLYKVQEIRGNDPLGLRGIVFQLRRVPERISTPGFGRNAGKRQRVEKWLVRLEPMADWVTTQLALARSDYAIEAEERPALTVDADYSDAEQDVATPQPQPLPAPPQAQPQTVVRTGEHPHIAAVAREFPEIGDNILAAVLRGAAHTLTETETVDYARAYSAAKRAGDANPTYEAQAAVAGEMSIVVAQAWRTKSGAPVFSALTGAQLENIADDPKSSPLTKQAARLVLAANARAAQDNVPQA